jgi:hypothetical protein
MYKYLYKINHMLRQLYTNKENAAVSKFVKFHSRSDPTFKTIPDRYPKPVSYHLNIFKEDIHI